MELERGSEEGGATRTLLPLLAPGRLVLTQMQYSRAEQRTGETDCCFQAVIQSICRVRIKLQLSVLLA